MTRKSIRRGKAAIPGAPHVAGQSRNWTGRSLPDGSIVRLLEATDILPMCLQGADGLLLGMNDAWLRLARRDADLLARQCQRAVMAAGPRGSKWRQAHCTVGGGRRIHVLTASASLPKGMQVVLALDITRLKVSLERLRRSKRLTDELYRTGYALTIEHLSTWLIHEISQPVMATVATAQTARRLLGRGRPDLREIGQSIEEVMAYQRRAGKVIQRLRAVLPKREAKRTRLEVRELILEAVRFLSDRGDLRGVRVRLSLAGSPLSVRGARAQLRQVFLNVILGAVGAMRATPAQQRRLWISTTVKSKYAPIHIVVRHPAQRAPKVDHIQFSGALARSHGDAAALGLAVADAIIVEHGGRMWVRRGRGGAEVHVALPVAPDRSE